MTNNCKTISNTEMQSLYERLKTPYKYGPVVKVKGQWTDSPVVFKDNGRFYMSYVQIDASKKDGYKTSLAVSDDLLSWQTLGQILNTASEWDQAQTGGYAQLQDIEFGGSNCLRKIDGKYIFAYLGGNTKGYEGDPLCMGLATATDLLRFDSYEKLPCPILSGIDEDVRRGETLTIYKGNIFYDVAKVTGYPYVCAYNAKDETHRESIFLAVSENGFSWKRWLSEAVIPVWECADDVLINGDPQIIKINDTYVMLYFVFDGKGAYNTFAASKDLKNWTKWEGKPLMKAEEPWENVNAHKQWTICEKGIVYQYYCAVNDQNERFIALATSKKIC